ncbi:hypothetical protein [Streptomyces sp. YGL11-2]|uniref:hypothetical protein n=1 Tax=Streptomyces sp. YGL11-2 TaxID=3414028 RepID=UPI003CF85652
MELPYIVVDQLDADQLQQHTFVGDADRPRAIEKGIWRRTQEKATAALSGWSGEVAPGAASSTTATGTAASPPRPRPRSA